LPRNITLTTSFLNAVNGATQRLTLPDDRTLDVKLPAGTSEGQILRLRGRGSPGRNDAPSSDGLIEIHVASHRYFSRDGQDIRLVLPITLQEAVIGGQVETPTPGGPVKLRIPAHADSGTELRLRGRGVPAHGGQIAGDLFVTLKIMIGPPDQALDDFIRDWTPTAPVSPRAAMEAGQ
jgi:DnaJ-class molecular chaperone